MCLVWCKCSWALLLSTLPKTTPFHFRQHRQGRPKQRWDLVSGDDDTLQQLALSPINNLFSLLSFPNTCDGIRKVPSSLYDSSVGLGGATLPSLITRIDKTFSFII